MVESSNPSKEGRQIWRVMRTSRRLDPGRLAPGTIFTTPTRSTACLMVYSHGQNG